MAMNIDFLLRIWQSNSIFSNTS